MKFIKAFLLILLVIFFAYIIFFRNSAHDRIQCKLLGGRWEVPRLPIGSPVTQGYCYHPPNDEGKTCYQNSDCQIDCIASSKTDNEGYILGSCGKYSILICAPTIPNKTNNRESLQRGGCV